jgi:glycosyltransferase involved in cell wall biosynthesis
MRVYYISSGSFGCYIVRCLLPLVALGFDGDHTSIHPFNKTAENKALAAKASDVVVFHRPEDSRKLELARLLKKLGKKIVMDNDDTYKQEGGIKLNTYFNKERVERGLGSVNKIVDAFIVEADLVTTTTEWLADEYRKLNVNVAVLPNCVDPFYFEEPLKNETEVVRIGITGSIGMSYDLDVLAPIIKHYEHDPRVKIVFFSLPANRESNPISYKAYEYEYNFLDSVEVEWHPLVDADLYYNKINSLKLDIMLIPRADNYFNRAKSNLKFLEASMFEIPVIASGFTDGKSPYQVIPEDQKHLVLITDNSKWIEEIEKMIIAKDRRREMGRKAKEYVVANYNIEDKSLLWEQAYAKLLE